MDNRTPMAGGFFLILPVIIGFLWGASTGRAMPYALVGLGVGVILALAVWAFDRRKN